MAKVFVNKRKVITTTSDEVTEEVVTEAIRLHMSKLVKNYVESEDMYLSQHEVLKMTKKDSNLKTALYIGRDLNMTIKLYGDFFSCLDYLKVGSYISNLGGLDSKTTNQRLYSLKGVKTEGEFTDYETVFTDITYKLQK